MFRRLNRIANELDRLERVITAITGIILGLLALLVGWQVVARYIFRTGLFWAEELTLVAMMWATLLGAAGCIWTDSHVRLHIFIDWLPASFRLWILTLMDILIMWFAFFIFKEGINLAQRTMGGKMSALGIPIGTTYIILPVAAVLMILFTLVTMLLRIIRHYAKKEGE